MIKKYFCVFLSCILLFQFNTIVFGEDKVDLTQITTNSSPKSQGAPSIAVTAKSAVLMEPSTGQVLLQFNENEKLPIASVTKVMTLLLIYEALEHKKINIDDVVTVSEHAASMGGSQIYLEPMEQQTVKDLIKSICIASANDSSVAMAEFIAGSEDGFVTMMNQKCVELEMVNTHFVNVCGLDEDNHYSSAKDVAIMSRALITKYPQVFDFTKIWQDTIIHKTQRGSEEFGLANTNKLIKSYEGATGLKTGSTSKALYCLSGTATRENMDLIAVVLGAPDPSSRFHETIKLFDYGFANFTLASGEDVGTVKGSIQINKGQQDSVPILVSNKISLVVGKGSNRKLENKVEILDGINAPVAKGTKAGEILYVFEGKEIGRADLVVSEFVKKANLTDTMQKLLIDWVSVN